MGPRFRGDDPSRIRWVRFAKMRGSRGLPPCGRGRNNADRVRGLIHHVKQPISFPRRMSASGFCIVASLTPNRGVGGAPRNVRVLGEAPVGPAHSVSKTRVNALMTRQARRLARRLASHDAGRSPLGAPPWRFWASGPRFRLLRRLPSYNGGQLPSGSVQRAPRRQVVVPGRRIPGPPGGGRLRPARRRTPRLAPPSGSSPETPLNERG